MHHWLEVSGISFLLLTSKLKTENSELAFPPLLYQQRAASTYTFSLHHHSNNRKHLSHSDISPNPLGMKKIQAKISVFFTFSADHQLPDF
jgi:hypothetical protein